MTWAVTGAMVRSYQESDEPPTLGLESAAAAATAYVPTIPALAKYFVASEEDPAVLEFTPPQDVTYGAVMLAARWYARRGALLGAGDVSGYSDFGTATILRHDPDIARLLRIGTASGGLVFGAPTPVVEVDA